MTLDQTIILLRDGLGRTVYISQAALGTPVSFLIVSMVNFLCTGLWLTWFIADIIRCLMEDLLAPDPSN